jgi:hypothetical protein
VNRDLALKIADAVLYEGYMLYPYRPSALKNQQRWSFGIIYPQDYPEVRSGTERSGMHSEFLLRIRGNCKLHIQLRFLHLIGHPAVSAAAGKDAQDESIVRSVEFDPDLHVSLPQRYAFSLPGNCGAPESGIQRELQGALIVRTETIGQDLLKITIEVRNETRCRCADLERDSAMLCALVSAHLILTAECGEFISLLDPPEELRECVSACKNVGNFPVLLGVEGERDMMLCSPIILYDYPQIALESAGDFYDCTEIDEMLTLRVMTLSDDEKDEMRTTEHARRLLERTEQSAREQLMRTHGTIRRLGPVSEPTTRQSSQSGETTDGMES